MKENKTEQIRGGGLEDLKPYPHETEPGYCCACDYDIAYFNSKLSEQRQSILEEVENAEEDFASELGGDAYLKKDTVISILKK